jgi:formylglycine-generating enzyme required for sulfatase activity
MTEKGSEQKRQTWTVLFAAAVVLIAIGVGWRGFSSPRSALAGEPAQAAKVSPRAQGLPKDLVEVADAQYASLDGLAAGSREAQERQRRAVAELGVPLEVKTRKTGIVFRLVPAGKFTMGSPSSEGGRDPRETAHEVTLSEAFYCGKFEVTQGQWERVMTWWETRIKSTPSYFKDAGKDAPVERVSWNDCHSFLNTLCQIEGVREGTYRLLTEAQWEYACRAGTTTPFCYGNDLDSSLANFAGVYPYGSASKGQYRSTTVAVGSFRANGWGLYDMHGNVWEWCQDRDGPYPSGSVKDPRGPNRDGYWERLVDGYKVQRGLDNVVRGGSWRSGGRHCRSANRRWFAFDYRSAEVGFRLARTTPSYP